MTQWSTATLLWMTGWITRLGCGCAENVSPSWTQITTDYSEVTRNHEGFQGIEWYSEGMSLEPSAQMSSLSLPPTQMVNLEDATSHALIPDEAKAEIDKRVEQVIDTIKKSNIVPDGILNSIQNMGNKEVQSSAAISSRLLDTPMRNAQKSVDQDSPIANNLVELRRIIDDLDPTLAGSKKKKLFGLFSMGTDSKIEDFFRKYESNQQHLNKVLEALKKSSQELALDNQSMLIERNRLKESAQVLAKYIYMADTVTERLEAEVAELEVTDPDKALALRSTALFYALQKNQDLKTHALVIAQNYAGLNLIISNNNELQKSVERARNTTLSALRGAIMMQNALNGQTAVTQQVQAINSTTERMLVATSKQAAENSLQIQKQASETTLDWETVKESIATIQNAMDEVDRLRAESTKNMRVAIDSMTDSINNNDAQVKALGSSFDTDWLTVQ